LRVDVAALDMIQSSEPDHALRTQQLWYDKLAANYLAFITLASIRIGYAPMSPRPGLVVQLARQANHCSTALGCVQPLLKKYSGFPKTQITSISPPSCPTEGCFANVTNAGRDAVDASGASDESANADGEVAWS
jgi:hypothetical protein